MLVVANLFGLGNPVELAIIGVVAVVLFGSTKIGQLGKSMGEGLREFKKATREDGSEPSTVSTAQPVSEPTTPAATTSPNEEASTPAQPTKE